MFIIDLEAKRDVALARADQIVSAAENAKRPLSATESATVDSCTTEANSLNAEIARIKQVRAHRAHSQTSVVQRPGQERMMPKTFTPEYLAAFHAWLPTGEKNPGNTLSASLVEGTNTAGGFAVPIVVDDQIVPLAPQDLAVRRLATVIPTKSDIKVPTKTAKGGASPKAEALNFAGSAPAIGQFTLSAFVLGAEDQTSIEIAEDAPAFNTFCLEDISIGVQEYEENKFCTGSGVNEPQGLIGNVGAGVTEEPDSSGNLVSVNGVLDLIGTLKDSYHLNASFLMQRTTSIILRKAQLQTNAFVPIWSRVGAQDYLFGYPCQYSASLPAAARGNAPILFGDFRRGYVIGDRGGSAIIMKILNQMSLAQGLISLFAFRRTDGRVRRSEAIQQYNIAAS